MDAFRYEFDFFFLEASCRHRRYPDTHPGGIHRSARIIRNDILIDRDAYRIQILLRFFPRNAIALHHIEHDHMIFCPAEKHLGSVLLHFFLQYFGILQYLPRVVLKPWLERFAESDRFGRDSIQEGSPLHSWKSRPIYRLG